MKRSGSGVFVYTVEIWTKITQNQAGGWWWLVVSEFRPDPAAPRSIAR